MTVRSAAPQNPPNPVSKQSVSNMFRAMHDTTGADATNHKKSDCVSNVSLPAPNNNNQNPKKLFLKFVEEFFAIRI